MLQFTNQWLIFFLRYQRTARRPRDPASAWTTRQVAAAPAASGKTPAQANARAPAAAALRESKGKKKKKKKEATREDGDAAEMGKNEFTARRKGKNCETRVSPLLLLLLLLLPYTPTANGSARETQTHTDTYTHTRTIDENSLYFDAYIIH